MSNEPIPFRNAQSFHAHFVDPEQEAPRSNFALSRAMIAAMAGNPNFCQWCFNPMRRGRRSLVDVEALRRVLLVPMTTPFDPPICDACYEGVVGTAVPEPQLVETPNFLLRNIGGDGTEMRG